jgi:hypothetical protein
MVTPLRAFAYLSPLSPMAAIVGWLLVSLFALSP